MPPKPDQKPITPEVAKSRTEHKPESPVSVFTKARLRFEKTKMAVVKKLGILLRGQKEVNLDPEANEMIAVQGEFDNNTLQTEKLLSPEQKFAGFSASLEQTTTRGDGEVQLGEAFARDKIDFKSAVDHLIIHHEGEVAGSQFNGKIFKNPEEVQKLLQRVLPESLQYDQFGRAELTLDIVHPGSEPIGWTGVKSKAELEEAGVVIERKMRIPGGLEDTVDGIEGAWYPEMAYDPNQGRMVVVVDEQGQIKNPRGKFEPKVDIATVSEQEFRATSKTDKLTVIIQKDRNTGEPAVLTIFPGENAPPVPSRINAADYQANSLQDPLMRDFWENHAFIQTSAASSGRSSEVVPALENKAPLEATFTAQGAGALLNLEIPNLPEGFSALGEQWKKKDEFHLTLVGFGAKLDQRLKGANPSLSNQEAKAQVKELIAQAAQGKTFQVTLLDEIRVVEKGENKTLVQLCDVEGAEEFYQALEAQLGFPVERPPYHVTLFTRENGQAIGITNQAQLDELSKKLEGEDLAAVRRHLETSEAEPALQAEPPAENQEDTDQWPGEKLSPEDLPVLEDPPTQYNPSDYSDWLIVYRKGEDDKRRVIAASYVEDLTSEPDRPFEEYRFLKDIENRVAKKGLEGFEVDIFPVSQTASLDLYPLDVPIEDLTGGKSGWEYQRKVPE